MEQFPKFCEFKPDDRWPADLIRLFKEAMLSFAGGAYTASAIVCRKILMVIAVQKGDAEGKSFLSYVDYITGTVLTFPKAKASIEAIRQIGNDANHKVAFVDDVDARRAMSITQYVLDAVYAMPTA